MEVCFSGLIVMMVFISIIFTFLVLPRNTVMGFMLAWFWKEQNVWQWLETQIKNKGDGTTVRFKSLFVQQEIVVTTSPSNIEYIYNNNINFCRPNYFKLISSENLHQGQDVPVIPPFCLDADPSFVELSLHLIQKLVNERLLPFLQVEYQNSSVVNHRDVLLSLGFDYLLELVAMGGDNRCLVVPYSNQLAKAFSESVNYHKIMGFALFYHEPLWSAYSMVNSSKRRRRRALKTVYSFVSNIVVEDTPRKGNDVLSSFMKAHGISMEFLCINLILACKDTPAHGLCNLFWLLNKHPQVEEKIFTELREILERRINSKYCNIYSMISDSDICFSLNELKEMQYLEAVLRETMRLYPPFPVDCREVMKDGFLPDGTVVKGGSKVLCFVYGANRRESEWGEEAQKFKPERWINAHINDSHNKLEAWDSYQYPVWNEISLGRELGYLVMKAVAANIVLRYHVKVEDDSMVFKAGVPVTLHSRVDNLQIAF